MPCSRTTADKRFVSVRRWPQVGRSGTAERKQTTESSLHDVSGTTTVDGHVRGRNVSAPRHPTVEKGLNSYPCVDASEVGTNCVAIRTGLGDRKTGRGT